MNTTRETPGTGSTNSPRRSRSRVSSDSFSVSRGLRDRVPELIAGADGLHLDQQAPLTVTDQHHPAEGGVLALGVEPRHRRVERVSQERSADSAIGLPESYWKNQN